MPQTISQTNGAWFKVFMVIFTAGTLTFIGYAVGNMSDRYTGTQARMHIARPYHEGAGQRLAVLEQQIEEINRRTASIEAKLDVAISKEYKDSF